MLKKNLLILCVTLWSIAIVNACDWSRYDNSCQNRACPQGSPSGSSTTLKACYMASADVCCQCIMKITTCSISGTQISDATRADIAANGCAGPAGNQECYAGAAPPGGL